MKQIKLRSHWLPVPGYEQKNSFYQPKNRVFVRE
jgi:hypothetical protein